MTHDLTAAISAYAADYADACDLIDIALQAEGRPLSDEAYAKKAAIYDRLNNPNRRRGTVDLVIFLADALAAVIDAFADHVPEIDPAVMVATIREDAAALLDESEALTAALLQQARKDRP